MFNVYKYKLPFKNPFITGAETYNNREGLIVRFINNESDLISEIAPLPGFSSETLSEVIEVLTTERDTIDSFFSSHFSKKQLNDFVNSCSNYPSLQFGLSSLGLFLLADRRGDNLPHFLNRSLNERLNVNAVVGSSDDADLKQQIKKLYHSGFNVVKCKIVGKPGNLPQILTQLSTEFPNLIFRLDANQTWNFTTIERFSEQFANLPVEYVEDPLHLKNITQFRQLLNKCKLPVAADESIVQFGLSHIIAQEYTPSYYILKPMLIGNLIQLFATIIHSKHLDERSIYTTSLESIVGRQIITMIAGMYGSKSLAHGLNTGILFSDDLIDVPRFRDGLPNKKNNTTKLVNFKMIDSSKLELIF